MLGYADQFRQRAVYPAAADPSGCRRLHHKTHAGGIPLKQFLHARKRFRTLQIPVAAKLFLRRGRFALFLIGRGAGRLFCKLLNHLRGFIRIFLIGVDLRRNFYNLRLQRLRILFPGRNLLSGFDAG